MTINSSTMPAVRDAGQAAASGPEEWALESAAAPKPDLPVKIDWTAYAGAPLADAIDYAYQHLFSLTGGHALIAWQSERPDTAPSQHNVALATGPHFWSAIDAQVLPAGITYLEPDPMLELHTQSRDPDISNPEMREWVKHLRETACRRAIESFCVALARGEIGLSGDQEPLSASTSSIPIPTWITHSVDWKFERRHGRLISTDANAAPDPMRFRNVRIVANAGVTAAATTSKSIQSSSGATPTHDVTMAEHPPTTLTKKPTPEAIDAWAMETWGPGFERLPGRDEITSRGKLKFGDKKFSLNHGKAVRKKFAGENAVKGGKPCHKKR